MFFAVVDVQSGNLVSLTEDEEEAAEALTPGTCWGTSAVRKWAYDKALKQAAELKKREKQHAQRLKTKRHTSRPLRRCAGCGGMIYELQCSLCFVREKTGKLI